MNILFVAENTYGEERIGIQILSSIARNRGHNTAFITIDSMSPGENFKTVSEYNPFIIAYTAMTGEHLACQKINSLLKQRFQFLSLFGGPHYTFCPEEIKNDRNIDIICRGEGEGVFGNVLESIENSDDFSSIQNISSMKNNNAIHNPLRPLIENLDEIPFADRRLVSIERGEARYGGSSLSIYLGRGCPFSCSYCYNNVYRKMCKGLGRYLRWRSVDNFINELIEIKSRADFINIPDDTFNSFPLDNMRNFCREYKSQLLPPGRR